MLLPTSVDWNFVFDLLVLMEAQCHGLKIVIYFNGSHRTPKWRVLWWTRPFQRFPGQLFQTVNEDGNQGFYQYFWGPNGRLDDQWTFH